MKKIVGTLVGLSLVYIGICFSLGFIAESSLKEQLDHHNQTAGKLNGVKMELSQFSRGIFGSEMDIKIIIAGTNPIASQFGIESHSKIQHGPFLFLNGFSIGAYATQSTLVINTPDEEVNKKIKSVFGDSIGLITANYGFAKTYTGDWTVEAIDSTNDGTQVKVDKSVMTFSGDFKTPDAPNMKSEINIGAVLIKDEVSEVKIDPWTGSVTQEYFEAGVPISNMLLSTKKISIESGMGFPMTLENLSIEQKQTVADRKINTLVALRLEKFTGPMPVNNTFYQIEFNNIPVESLKKLNEIIKNSASDLPQDQQLALLLPALSNLLADGVEMKLSLGSELMDGKADGALNVVYKANGKNLMELQSADEILGLFGADLNVTISESIVNQSPMAGQLEPLVGTYVTLENGVYNLKAALKETQLTIGTQVIPAEQYMPLLMMGAMGLTAGQSAEDPGMVDEADAYSADDVPDEEYPTEDEHSAEDETVTE